MAKMKFNEFSRNDMLDKDMQNVVTAGVKLTQEYTERDSKTFVQSTYDEHNHTFSEALVKVCLKGTPFEFTSLDMVKNPQVVKNIQFQQNFNAVIAQTITPIVPAVVSAKFEDLAETRQVGFGDNAIFNIKSNELFVINDIAEGVQTGGLQRCYNQEVSVSAHPKQIRYDMPWYQVASGIFDFGEWAYKIGVSYAAYINMMVIKTVTDYVDNDMATGVYKVAGFTDANWIKLAKRVRAVNGNADVIALGDLSAVGTVIPNTVGLQYGLGEEMAKYGYLDRYKGVPITVIDPSIVPTTENTTALLATPEDMIFFLPVGGYKPVKIVLEGQQVSVEADPTKTADKTMGITITMRIGMSFVLGSRFGVITDIK